MAVAAFCLILSLVIRHSGLDRELKSEHTLRHRPTITEEESLQEIKVLARHVRL
jgi:hypothetical protein